MTKTKTYFASDFHLGLDLDISSKDREKIIVKWLESIKSDACALYLVGDVFDHWFEYKKVVPKGYMRFFGKLAELSDAGVKIYFFKGNHDMWVFNYFNQELDITIYDNEVVHEMDGQRFYITHGDGLGKGDQSYKFIKAILRNPFSQWLYSIIHPTWGLALMKLMSKRSRDTHAHSKDSKDSKEQSILLNHAEQVSQNIDFFICGHMHSPQLKTLSDGSTIYCNLGDWMTHFSYGVWDGATLKLEKYSG